MSSTSVDFPAAGDAGHAREAAERKVTRRCCDCFPFAPSTLSQPGGHVLGVDRCEPVRGRLHAMLRHGDRRAAGEILRRERLSTFSTSASVPCATSCPPRAPRPARDQARDPPLGWCLRRARRRSTELPRSRSSPQSGDEAIVIALVEPNARLVEHIETSGESGADLRRQPDALRFAAGERAALAIE